MQFEINASADVTALKQTIAGDFHATVRLPHNPVTILRCLRGNHADDCSVMDHVDVLDMNVDFRIE